MIRFSTAGESHGEALVALVSGLPAGVPVDQARLGTGGFSASWDVSSLASGTQTQMQANLVKQIDVINVSLLTTIDPYKVSDRAACALRLRDRRSAGRPKRAAPWGNRLKAEPAFMRLLEHGSGRP